MSLHEQYIPGRWVDGIDVNDFVKLNKKPFLDKPIFLQHALSQTPIDLTDWVAEDKQVDLSYASFDSPDINWFPLYADSPVMKRKIGRTEKKKEMKKHYDCLADESKEDNPQTVYERYQHVATSDMNKMVRIGLLQHVPHDYTPPSVIPDIRLVPLYGTKQLIKTKRSFLTKMERLLQTTAWIDQRLAKHREIEALKSFERFAKSLGVNVTKPAENTQEAMDMLYVTLLSIVIENPSVEYALTDIFTFIDIFAERELLVKAISEPELQTMMDEFVQKILRIRFTPSPMIQGSSPFASFLFGETLGETVTKTTYRFLSSLDRLYTSPFALRIIWTAQLPESFKETVFHLYRKGMPLTIMSPRNIINKPNPVLLPFGLQAEVFHEIAYYGGGFDLEKAFYLALNGGKEWETNTNLSSASTPARPEQSYEELLKKFQDFLSFAVLGYAECINSILYLHDTADNHPLRSSFISDQPFYSVTFGFFHLKRVVHLLAALQNDDAEWVMNKEKWVTALETGASCYDNEDVVMTHLISYLTRELAKIPLYKEAKHDFRFHAGAMHEIVTPDTIPYDWSLPPEYMQGNFHANVEGADLSDHFIREAFSQNVTELNVFLSPTFRMTDSILHHSDYRWKK